MSGALLMRRPSCWRAALTLGMLVCDRAADDLQRIWPKVAATRWRLGRSADRWLQPLCAVHKHGIPFELRQNTSFKWMDNVYLWMIEPPGSAQRVGFPVRRVDAAQEVDHAIAGVPLWEDDDSTSPLEPPPVPPAATLSWQMLEREVRLSSNTQVQI